MVVVSTEATGTGREALADALRFDVLADDTAAGRAFRNSIARRILASDWLAAVVAEAERRGGEKALREAADEARAHAVSCPVSCGTAECREANEITATWLDDRAGGDS